MNEKLPFNIEAEQALLGSLLIDNDVVERIEAALSAHDFYDPLHSRIYDSICRVVLTGGRATPTTLGPDFVGEAPLGDGRLTVPQYLGRLVRNATSTANAPYYAKTLKDLSLRRAVIQTAEDVARDAYDAPANLDGMEIVEQLEDRILSLNEAAARDDGPMGMVEVTKAAIELAASAYQMDSGLAGLTTGFESLDRRVGGLQPSDLVIIAGRPSMGKTALAVNIARHIAEEHLRDKNSSIGCPVAIFSLEMSAAQLGSRLISLVSGVPSERVRRGRIDRREFNNICLAGEQVGRLPLYIDQTGRLSVSRLMSRARRLKRVHGIGCIVVDYLQLLTGSDPRQGRVQEITEITSCLKALAKELDLPVIALSQLSRQVESRPDKRPVLADLRDSGSIEQDADVVMFVYREEYYVQRSVPEEGTPEYQDWLDKMERVAGRADIIVAKQRNGPIGSARLLFDSTFTEFSDPSAAEPEEQEEAFL